MTFVLLFLPEWAASETKLLIDLSMSLTEWRYLWVTPHSRWTDETLKNIPAEDTILIVDDAHQYSDLNHLVTYVAAENPAAPRRKLLIATPLGGQAYVNETLARDADESFIRRFDSLREANPRLSWRSPKEVLGAQYEGYAEGLARGSADIPLITVVGGRLIARRQISPELLNNDTDFPTLCSQDSLQTAKATCLRVAGSTGTPPSGLSETASP